MSTTEPPTKRRKTSSGGSHQSSEGGSHKSGRSRAKDPSFYDPQEQYDRVVSTAVGVDEAERFLPYWLFVQQSIPPTPEQQEQNYLLLELMKVWQAQAIQQASHFRRFLTQLVDTHYPSPKRTPLDLCLAAFFFAQPQYAKEALWPLVGKITQKQMRYHHSAGPFYAFIDLLYANFDALDSKKGQRYKRKTHVLGWAEPSSSAVSLLSSNVLGLLAVLSDMNVEAVKRKNGHRFSRCPFTTFLSDLLQNTPFTVRQSYFRSLLQGHFQECRRRFTALTRPSTRTPFLAQILAYFHQAQQIYVFGDPFDSATQMLIDSFVPALLEEAELACAGQQSMPAFASAQQERQYVVWLKRSLTGDFEWCLCLYFSQSSTLRTHKLLHTVFHTGEKDHLEQTEHAPITASSLQRLTRQVFPRLIRQVLAQDHASRQSLEIYESPLIVMVFQLLQRSLPAYSNWFPLHFLPNLLMGVSVGNITAEQIMLSLFQEDQYFTLLFVHRERSRREQTPRARGMHVLLQLLYDGHTAETRKAVFALWRSAWNSIESDLLIMKQHDTPASSAVVAEDSSVHDEDEEEDEEPDDDDNDNPDGEDSYESENDMADGDATHTEDDAQPATEESKEGDLSKELEGMTPAKARRIRNRQSILWDQWRKIQSLLLATEEHSKHLDFQAFLSSCLQRYLSLLASLPDSETRNLYSALVDHFFFSGNASEAASFTEFLRFQAAKCPAGQAPWWLQSGVERLSLADLPVYEDVGSHPDRGFAPIATHQRAKGNYSYHCATAKHGLTRLVEVFESVDEDACRLLYLTLIQEPSLRALTQIVESTRVHQCRCAALTLLRQVHVRMSQSQEHNWNTLRDSLDGFWNFPRVKMLVELLMNDLSELSTEASVLLAQIMKHVVSAARVKASWLPFLCQRVTTLESFEQAHRLMELLSGLVYQAGDALHQLDMMECVLHTARRYLFPTQASSTSPSVHIISLFTSLASQLCELVPQVEGDVAEGVEDEFFAIVQEALTGMGSYSKAVLLAQIQLLSEYCCREMTPTTSNTDRQAARESLLLDFSPTLQHAVAHSNALAVQHAAQSILTWMSNHKAPTPKSERS